MATNYSNISNNSNSNSSNSNDINGDHYNNNRHGLITRNNPTQACYASDLLYGFDIPDDESRQFLESLVSTGRVPPAERAELVRLSLLRGQEEWDMAFACAGALREGYLSRSGGGWDPGLELFLAYALGRWGGEDGVVRAAGVEGREAGLEEKSAVEVGDIGAAEFGATDAPKKARRARRVTSRFWTDEAEVPGKATQLAGGSGLSLTTLTMRHDAASTADEVQSLARATTPRQQSPAEHQQSPGEHHSLLLDAPEQTTLDGASSSDSSSASPHLLPAHQHTPTLKRSQSLRSPFFTPSPTKKSPRPARGTVSSLPFPPLSAPRFGLVQEALAADPFWLLVAVTFLIRTTGRAAIPVFYRVKEWFPTIEELGRAAEEGEEGRLGMMIKGLGLVGRRCSAIARYARGWLERPPERGRKWRVVGYPKLRGLGGDVDGGEGGGDEGEKEEEMGDGGDAGVDGELATPRRGRRAKAHWSEWEIGHLTQGRYAIDSWRIFCRDIFLGKSDSWMGREAQVNGNEVAVEEEGEDFEPEWQRVLPEDKELRACLRWMWMREGVEWDPATGRMTPLRDDMRAAVEELRVKYDEKGELVILEEAAG